MAQGRSTEIITMIKWIRTSRLSIKELSLLTWYKGKSTSAPGELRQYQVNGSTFLLTLVWRFANVNNWLFKEYTKRNLPNNIRKGDPDPNSPVGKAVV